MGVYLNIVIIFIKVIIEFLLKNMFISNYEKGFKGVYRKKFEKDCD